MKSDRANCRAPFGLRKALIALVVLGGVCSAADQIGPLEAPPRAMRVGYTESEAAAATNGVPQRTALWPFFWRHRAIYDSDGAPVTPHSAVARIIVPEDGVTAFGSGTLVDVRDQYGLVVTCWHVVHDASGAIEVVFPSGFRSHARALKLDEEWDLAALVIWRPPIEPVRLAAHAPRQGEALTIHGYGRGQYRIATGRCTQYYSPRPDFPAEMVELDVEARQGDSGGPIFNQQGELAGVLFGAGQGTTLGSFGPRVGTFLATLAPDIGQATEQSQVAIADRPAPNVNPTRIDTIIPPQPPWPSSPWSPPIVANDKGRLAQPRSMGGQSDVQSAANVSRVPASNSAVLSWRDIASHRWYEPAKSGFAIVGLAVVVLRLVKLVR